MASEWEDGMDSTEWRQEGRLDEICDWLDEGGGEREESGNQDQVWNSRLNNGEGSGVIPR